MQFTNNIIVKKIKRQSYRAEQGFTLIELMIVVVVVSVLVAIALPSYTEYVNKGRRSDAMSALLDTANRQEQFMLDRNTYTKDMTQLYINLQAEPLISTEGHYTIDAEEGETGNILTSYALTATPLATSPQNDDAKCESFRLTSTGEKTARGELGNDCWTR
ncbi:MAG: type IV pilin protein [Gammaproteobacteria bacterium]|nr:type IV pilin protein [Gammaproteobacteria bacterium]